MTRPSLTRTLVFLGAASLAACVDSGADAPMRILGNVVPEAGCAVDSSSNLYNDDGVIEVGATQGYVFTPAVVNDVVISDGELVGPKIIYVEGARVAISFYDTVRFPAATTDAWAQQGLLEFRVPTSGVIEPGGGASAFSFEVVPPELITAIGGVLGAERGTRTTLDVHVQMFGTKGGGDVESNVFRYPVQVCVGCLHNDLGACATLSDSVDVRNGGSCNYVQDGMIDCCDNYSVCPAAPPTGGV